MKTITQRRYDILSDFNKIYDFLTETYDFYTSLGFETICDREIWRSRESEGIAL